MLSIFFRIASVDMNGFTGREHHPQPHMVGRIVRITNMDTVPATDSDPTLDNGPWQTFHGILVDATGADEPNGEVELTEFEIETKDNMPVLYAVPVIR